MKKIFTCLFSAVILVSLCLCGNQIKSEAAKEAILPSQSANSSNGFYVSGTKLYDATGKEFVLRGINHAHTWYKGYLDTTLTAIANTGSNSVRIVLSNGQQWNKDDLNSIKSIINKCREKKLITILEVHDATGKYDLESLQKAADYWIEMKSALIGNEAYVILNIANEWYGGWDTATWKEGYLNIIPKLRDAGIKNTLMVDSAGWGQYAKSIEQYGQEILNSDSLRNTMFSIHMYGTAGKDAATIKANIDNVTNKNLCVVIGEFGQYHSDGDVDEDYIMSYCTQKNIGYMGWSWKGNSGGVEYLDIANQWDGSQLSSDWGEKLINGTNGIRKTSKICSVFGN